MGVTLAALLAEPETSELIVVVDGHDPQSTSVVSDLASSDPRVRLVALSGPSGSDAGRQAGAELARGEAILFVDDDVVVAPGCVAGHAAWHRGHARRVVLGYMPVLLGEQRRLEDLPGVLYDEGYQLICRSFDQSSTNILLNFWAGDFSIARADALQVGLFDRSFTAEFHGDRDFGLRCQAAGLEPVFDRSLLARHHYQRSWANFRLDSRRQGLGRVLVHARHEVVIGPLRLDEPHGRLAGWISRAARRRRLRPLVEGALTATAWLACEVRRPDIGLRAAWLIRLVGFEQGVIEGRRKSIESAAERPAAALEFHEVHVTPRDRLVIVSALDNSSGPASR